MLSLPTRSSSREGRIRVPTFFPVVYVSKGTLPPKGQRALGDLGGWSFCTHWGFVGHAWLSRGFPPAHRKQVSIRFLHTWPSWPWVKIKGQIVPPVNIRFNPTTKIPTKTGGACGHGSKSKARTVNTDSIQPLKSVLEWVNSPAPKWEPIGFDPQPHHARPTLWAPAKVRPVLSQIVLFDPSKSRCPPCKGVPSQFVCLTMCSLCGSHANTKVSRPPTPKYCTYIRPVVCLVSLHVGVGKCSEL